jgi:hypothetical protein
MTGALTTTGFTSTGIDDNATSTAITIDASENVGIGTGSPDCKLDVRKSGTTAAQGDTDLFIGDSGAASSTAQVQILGGASGFSNLYFSDTGSYSVGGFIYNHTDNYLATNVNGAERMRIDSSGNVTVETGNLVIGTSGKGIDFSATSDGSGTMTSEVLDDYETGTWTPAITDGTNSPTMAAQVGKYTKIGNLVTAEGYINVTAAGSATGNISIAGLPFTNDSAANNFGVCSFGYMNNGSLPSGTTPSGYIPGNTNYVSLYVWDSTYTTRLTMAEWGTADAIFEITYRV